MKPSSQTLKFSPLQGALGQIRLRLTSDYPSQVILAEPSLEEFQKQNLPPHCKVHHRPIRGPQVTTRGRMRRSEGFQNAVAYWPENELVRGTRSALIFVLNGEPNLRFADYSVRCRPGDIIVAPAEVPRFTSTRPQHEKITSHSDFDLLFVFYAPMEMLRIFIRISRFREGDNSRQLPRDDEAGWMKAAFLGNILFSLEEYLQADTERKHAVHLLTSFVLLLQEKIESGEALDRALPSDSLFLRHHNPMEKSLEYINNHLDRHLSIDIVARWVGLSRSPFTRQFREKTETSFAKYVAQKRLQRAEVLLSETDLPVERVGARSGLQPGHLRRVFREKHGCSPQEYRSIQNKNQNGRK